MITPLRTSLLIAGAIVAFSTVLTACSSFSAVSGPGAIVPDASGDEFVRLHFAWPATNDAVDVLDVMLPFEELAIEHLESSGVGTIDGNEIGNGEYDLYFIGPDSNEVWDALEPLLDESPIPVSRVELYGNDLETLRKVIEFPQ